jgi:hypothetical protein
MVKACKYSPIITDQLISLVDYLIIPARDIKVETRDHRQKNLEVQ